MEKYLIGVKMKINDLNTHSRVSSILHLSQNFDFFEKTLEEFCDIDGECSGSKMIQVWNLNILIAFIIYNNLVII